MPAPRKCCACRSCAPTNAASTASTAKKCSSGCAELNFTTGYAFNWESRGVGTRSASALSVAGDADRHQRALGRQAGRHQPARRRPDGAVGQRRVQHPPAPQRAATGSARRAGWRPAAGPGAGHGRQRRRRLPASGWWRCDAGARRPGGARRPAAVPARRAKRMPQALLLPRQSVWQKLRGIQPSVEVRCSRRPGHWSTSASARAPLAPLPPGAAGPVAADVDAGTGGRQVGAYARTGDACPASGWWRCDDPHGAGRHALVRARQPLAGRHLPGAHRRVRPARRARLHPAPQQLAAGAACRRAMRAGPRLPAHRCVSAAVMPASRHERCMRLVLGFVAGALLAADARPALPVRPRCVALARLAALPVALPARGALARAGPRRASRSLAGALLGYAWAALLAASRAGARSWRRPTKAATWRVVGIVDSLPYALRAGRALQLPRRAQPRARRARCRRRSRWPGMPTPAPAAARPACCDVQPGERWQLTRAPAAPARQRQSRRLRLRSLAAGAGRARHRLRARRRRGAQPPARRLRRQRSARWSSARAPAARAHPARARGTARTPA